MVAAEEKIDPFQDYLERIFRKARIADDRSDANRGERGVFAADKEKRNAAFERN